MKKHKTRKHHHTFRNVICACMAFAALCFLTLFSQYDSGFTQIQGAAVLKNKCETTPTSYVVFGSGDNFLYALDAEKGCPAWKFDAEADIKSTPTIYGNTIYVGTTENEMYAVSLTDGTEIWKADTNKMYAGTAADSAYVYAGDISGTLGAYAGADPTLTYTGHNIYTDVQLDNGILYFVDEYLKVGTLRAISTSTFTQKWSFSAKSQIVAPPLLTSDAIYVPSNENTLYKVSKQYGVPLATFKTQKSIRTKPAINSKGTLFFGSNDGYLYAVKSADLSLAWKYALLSEIVSSPAVDATQVYVAVKDTVYALNSATGSLVWKTTLKGKITAPLTIQGTRLYVPSPDFTLYTLDTTTGKQKWSYKTTGVLYGGVSYT